jgi:hypothetical protein
MNLQRLTEEQTRDHFALLDRLDAEWEARCHHIDKLRELILQEPYDSPVWDHVERLVSDIQEP